MGKTKKFFHLDISVKMQGVWRLIFCTHDIALAEEKSIKGSWALGTCKLDNHWLGGWDNTFSIGDLGLWVTAWGFGCMESKDTLLWPLGDFASMCCWGVCAVPLLRTGEPLSVVMLLDLGSVDLGDIGGHHSIIWPVG